MLRKNGGKLASQVKEQQIDSVDQTTTHRKWLRLEQIEAKDKQIGKRRFDGR